MANANVDAEKLVFAVDMVCFFMRKHYPNFEFELESNIANVVDNFRPHVRHHFSENFIKIINEIDETQGFIVQRDFSEMQRNKVEIDLPTLMEYFDSFKNANLAERFSVGNFLLFCARVSLISCFFFVSGRKSAPNYMIDIIKDSFPKDEDECRLLWNEIDKAAENYGSYSQGDATPSVFGREPSESIDMIPNQTEDSSKSNTQGNATSSLFGSEARESADVSSSAAEGSSRSNSQEAVFDNERREIADVISSGTEDSCSSSSTTNTESDSSANTQDMSSASSDESLNRLIMKLNRLAAPAANAAIPVARRRLAAVPPAAAPPIAAALAGANAVPLVAAAPARATAVSSVAATVTSAGASSVPSAAAAASNTGFVNYIESKQIGPIDAAAASIESVKYVENKQSDTTTATVLNTESVKCVKSKQSATVVAPSSTETLKCVESKESAIAVAASSSETVKYVEIKECATQAVPAENLESNIQNPSVSSSTSNKCPKIEIDFKTKFENAFMEVKTESAQKSPLKSPLKSCLGKRPSPRKGKVSFSEEPGDDSETEIKKPKIGSPESKD